MKYRPHTGSIETSKSRMVTLPSNLEALIAHLECTLPFGFEDHNLEVELYQDSPDQRVNWRRTYVVKLQGRIQGYTDTGPGDWRREATNRADFEQSLPKMVENRQLVFSRKPDGTYGRPWIEWAWVGFQAARTR